MKPMRRSFGGGFAGPKSAAAKLAIALVAGSVIFALALPRSSLLLLAPSEVIGRFFLWQPLTYAFIETSAMGVIFGALITWSIGGALEATLGSKRLLWLAIGTTFSAGLLTCAVGLVWPTVGVLRFGGGTVMTSVLWVGYGLAFGRSQLNFWGMPLTGHAFALIGVGFVFLNGAFQGWPLIVPDALGVGLVAAYFKLGSPRDLLLRLQTWRFHRRMRSRSKHLRVITKERNMPSDSDKFLH